MTTTVRIYTHSSLMPAKVSPAGGRFSSDGVLQLKQPYLTREKLTADTGSAVTSTSALDHDRTTMAFVQVQFGKAVHYRVLPKDYPVDPADSSDPTMSGDTVVEFGPGWTISFLESTE